ncbi:MAG: IreB family regulatory phosphoprotein [Ruminococcaceae bacterium]|nr:IreB family regulatory phosphoprotein [Oscillospiraceae bacterium]
MADNGKILYLNLHANDARPNDICQLDVPDVDGNTSVTKIEEGLTPKETLHELYRLIAEKGMDPVAQLSGFVITEEPTYIPDYKNARTLACKAGRDKLLFALLEDFFSEEMHGDD